MPFPYYICAYYRLLPSLNKRNSVSFFVNYLLVLLCLCHVIASLVVSGCNILFMCKMSARHRTIEGCEASVLGGLDGRVTPKAPLLLNPRHLSTRDQNTRKLNFFIFSFYYITKYSKNNEEHLRTMKTKNSLFLYSYGRLLVELVSLSLA